MTEADALAGLFWLLAAAIGFAVWHGANVRAGRQPRPPWDDDDDDDEPAAQDRRAA